MKCLYITAPYRSKSDVSFKVCAVYFVSCYSLLQPYFKIFLLNIPFSWPFSHSFHIYYLCLQCNDSRVTPVFKMRQCEFLTPYRRWRLWQTPCPSSRVSCRPARTCVLSGMRYCILFFIFEECLFYLNALMAEMMLQQRFIRASHFSLLFQVYCQVIKQTNHVPQPNSPANRAHWHLLTCMSCTFLPSRAILRYLRFHLKRCVQIFLCCF